MRRHAFWLALPPLALTSALLVARLPADLDARIVTRRHHNSDPLLTASLLQLNVASLLRHPSRYFEPPILFPDPNPYRSTEPFIAEALLALPFRLALGERPARVYTAVLLTTLALLAAFTSLLLRELGVRASLSLLGGCLSVLVATTTIFVDRLQSLSIQWLPLGLFFASRYVRLGGRPRLWAFAACAFLTVQASLYTSVMLVTAAIFLLPMLLALRAEAACHARLKALALALAAAAAACLLVLWPYLRDREDVAAYSTAAFAGQKNWGQGALADLAISPPEYGQLGWPLEPSASWDGAYPGAAFVLLLATACALALARGVRRLRSRSPPSVAGAAPGLPGRALPVLLLGLGAALVASAIAGGGLARAAADVLLWATLAAWCAGLALMPIGDPRARLRVLASGAGLAAFVLLLLSLGSPVALSWERPPLLHGLFEPLSSLLPALRELRELKRFLLPAGWAAAVAVVLWLELQLPPRPSRVAPLLVAFALTLGLLERARADTRSVSVPAPPEYYALLERSQTAGGLLELPFDPWGRIGSVKRMLWQPRHGRPIVAGKVSLDPAWYTPAGEVFGRFPSRESLLLLRAWGVTSVLDARPDAWREARTAPLPEGLVMRAELEQPGGPVRLYDVLPDPAPGALAEPETGDGRWLRPDPAAAALPHRAAVDGSLDTAAAFEGSDAPVIVVPGGTTASAVALDYGSGRFSRVPRQLALQALVDARWIDVTREPTGSWLQARAADQLLRRRRAGLIVGLEAPSAGPLRLVSSGEPWDLPELRLLTGAAGQGPGRR